MLQDEIFDHITRGFAGLPKTAFKILIRRDGFIPFGIVTVKSPEYDSSIGESRMWVHGVRFGGGKFFDEPLDRKNPKTSELESVVLAETPQLILTARRRPDLSDEDDNFMWLENPFGVQEARKVMEDVRLRDHVMSSLRRQLETQRRYAEYWEGHAKAMGDSQREQEERVRRLSKETSLLRDQVEFHKMVSQSAMAAGIELEATLGTLVKTARERGIETASSEWERAQTAITKVKQLRQEAGAVMEEKPPSGEVELYKRELEEEKKRREAAERQLEAERQKGKPPATPAT